MLISLCVVALAVGAYMWHGSDDRAFNRWFELVWATVGEQVQDDAAQFDAYGTVQVSVPNEPLGLESDNPGHQDLVEAMAEVMAESWSDELGCTHGTATIFEGVTVFRFYDRERMAELLGLRS